MAQSDRAAVISMQRAASIEFIKNSGGFAVRAIRGQKDPARGWDPKSNSKARSDDLLVQLSTSEDNLGLHLHGDIVDVDVDTDSPFIIPALDAFLPPCSHVWGRPSRPRTHRVYMLRDGADFDPGRYPLLRRLAKIPEAAVEVRGGPVTRGEYSLLPGSIHPSGETYEWADLGRARSSLTVTTVDMVLRAIRLAGAVSVVAPYWQEGMRNDLVMALSGFLYRVSDISEGLGDGAFCLDYQGAQHFLETLLNVTDDDKADRLSRVKTFERTWNKAAEGKAVTGATRIAEITGDKDIVHKLYTLLADSPDVAAIDEFITRFAVWQGPGVVVDMDVVKAGEKSLMSRQAFINSFGHCYITSAGGGAKLLPDLLFHMRATLRVSGVTFEPGQPLVVDTRSGKKVNQWSGFEIPPHDSPVTKEDVLPFYSYVKEVVADDDPDALIWVLGWLANIFKEPAKKPNTALVLVGKPGAGKSILGHSIIIPIIGRMHAAATNTVESVTKDFNVAFDNKLFIQCDEATNNKQKTMAARLKALISDPYKLVEPKGIDSFHKPNHSRFLFTSNDEEDAIHIGDGQDDRRYTILRVNPKYKGDVKYYWTPLITWLEKPENLAKVHRFLLDYKYDPHLIMRPYSTEAKALMFQQSWDAFDGWLASWVARNHPISSSTHADWYDAPLGTAKHIDRSEWPTFVSLPALVRDYGYFCRYNIRGSVDQYNEHQLAATLKRRGLPLVEGQRVRIAEFDDKKGKKVEQRLRHYTPPSRADVEAYLREKYGYRGYEEKLEETISLGSGEPDDSEF